MIKMAFPALKSYRHPPHILASVKQTRTLMKTFVWIKRIEMDWMLFRLRQKYFSESKHSIEL